MHWVYVLYSKRIDMFYKGITVDVRKRLIKHNEKGNFSTRKGVPWKLIWSIEKPNKRGAAILERKLKNLSRQKLIRILLNYQECIKKLDLHKWLYRLLNDLFASSKTF
ncbi:GIY-YIG nuclease family protein [Hyphobacterium sp. CCMP332]|nr:GIY-YIG nuclease family protein [Hyphobacterium sp. CCMP332]